MPVSVALNTIPGAPAAAATQSFIAGSTVNNLAATADGTATVKWYDAQTGGAALASTTVLENNKTYYAAQTSAEGCESARTAVTVTVGPATSVGSVETETFSVYPNPVTNGTFTVETEKAENAFLYDVNGKTIKAVTLLAGKNEVNIVKLPAGMYLLRTNSGKQVKLAVK